MEPLSSSPVEVFYSYSHKDEEFRDQLDKHLVMLKRRGIIKGWHDRRINPGQEWDGQISDHLNSAHIILLLVSADFLASDYCYDIEMTQAMQRHEAGEACVIPIILRPCDWSGASFSKLQALPKNALPIINWSLPDEAFLSIVVGIKDAIRGLSPQILNPHAASFIPAPPVVNFVTRRDHQGRDIVGRLKEELALQKRPLIALCGPGGVGKTTLAAEAARAMRQVFYHRIVWLSALSRADMTLFTLLDEIAVQLGQMDARLLAPELKERRVRRLLTTAPTLVVLDDFETLAPREQERCTGFLKHIDQYPALIITRWPVNDAYPIHLDAMSLTEAHEFLQQLIEQMQRPSAFDELDRDSIIRATGANPLVLQWLVKQIDLAKEPDTVLGYLVRGMGDAAERVFDRSFNLPQVGNDGRAVLLALSLFVPSASREALAEVAGFDRDLIRLDKALEGLAALSLVETTPGNKRLMIQGLTRELSKARLSRDHEADKFRQRFIVYFLRYAATHSRLPLLDFAALELEKNNVLSAINVLFDMSDKESVMQEIVGAIDFSNVSALLRVRGYWDAAIPGEEQHSEADKMPTESQIARFAHNVALIYQSRRKLKEARQLYEKSLKISESLGDRSRMANIFQQLATIALEQGELKEARQFYLESKEIISTLDDQSSLASILFTGGMIEEERNDRAEAARLFREALVIFNKIGSPYTEFARRSLEKIESEESSIEFSSPSD